MRFAINLNTLDTGQIAPVAEAAEELGFESAWLGEHIVLPRVIASPYPYGPRPAAVAVRYLHHELFSVLSFVGARTSVLRLGTGIALVPLRDPFNLARATATVDALTGGRLLAGVGLSWSKEEYAILGVDWETRGERLDEGVDFLRTLWREETPEFHGTFYDCPPCGFEPKPAQRPGPPVLVGGITKAAIRRAARIGDGWYAIARDAETAFANIATMRQALDEAGRAAEPFDCTTSLRELPDVATVERLEQAGYGRLGMPIGSEDPIADMKRVRDRFGSLMAR